ncbi:RNA-directed DNA polymerase from mobile element jockey-like [Brachionus plicatilis]|uniref:RNA-directed DNA polymerase from mobile element jockey-like n=1 Tax=Brachionus plicatilis TaxID=10195 RepID=A0A3M7RD38_BRAPC|nr:RNA-directed DNA polymerase from mobile element jockey-like [Brachionus plicatilis]
MFWSQLFSQHLDVKEDPDRIYSILHGPPLCKTNNDHLTLIWEYELKSKEINSDKTFCSSEIDWYKVLNGLKVDQMFDKFLFYYNSACEKFIPKSKNTNKNQPWMTKELREQIREKFKVWKTYMASGRTIAIG